MFTKTIMEMEAPEKLSSFTEERDVIRERDEHLFWRIKVVATKFTLCLFKRYGRP
jgi:hypothetical protein